MAAEVNVERVLRNVLYAAIKDDHEGFEEHLESFVTKDALLTASARAIDLTVLMILHKVEGVPGPKTIREVAENTALHSQWSGIDLADYIAYLTAIFNVTPLEQVLSLGSALRLPFIQCAHLLVMWHEPDEYWYDYLDRV